MLGDDEFGGRVTICVWVRGGGGGGKWRSGRRSGLRLEWAIEGRQLVGCESRDGIRMCNILILFSDLSFEMWARPRMVAAAELHDQECYSEQ